ncbi:hypothetical protein WKI68_10425 [Streptomyces sp. MS1.HAVA.3]|uniref:Fungal lipase-like domain-containing protein n=1 Tax=Streptomyces caledonius TaxID=3134107 RepID=A0ABU8U1M4_9ACTN
MGAAPRRPAVRAAGPGRGRLGGRGRARRRLRDARRAARRGPGPRAAGLFTARAAADRGRARRPAARRRPRRRLRRRPGFHRPLRRGGPGRDRAAEEPQARELATALARSVTAAALAAAGAEADCTGAERDRLVELLTTRLGGDARVPGARAAAVLGRLALRVTTQPLLNARRGSLTVGATPALGDILRYQARGHELREFLHARIAAEPGPTVLIGHSLGGIALVDLLALAAARGEPVPGTRLLVTVGSQAPFLYELGALTALEPGAKLPYGFPRWLNVYDRQDVLAYLAGPVFPGDPRVTDHEVRSRQPFPACHSAYWKQDSLYERIEQAVTEAEIG